MDRFNRDNRPNRNRSFDKPRYGGDRTMYKAVCARCGKQCEVPFKPTGDRPVFCKDCYNSNEGFEAHRQENRNAGMKRSGDRQMYEAICTNCGNKCQIPFRPTPGRDVLCSNCFEMREGSESHRFDKKDFEKPQVQRADTISHFPDYKSQFEQLNTKLDTILSLLAETTKVSPLDSVISEKVIDEIADEVTNDEIKKVEKKPARVKKGKTEAIKEKNKKLDPPKKK